MLSSAARCLQLLPLSLSLTSSSLSHESSVERSQGADTHSKLKAEGDRAFSKKDVRKICFFLFEFRSTNAGQNKENDDDGPFSQPPLFL